MKKPQQLLLIAAFSIAAGGCVSTTLGVAGAAVKGTVKVGTGVAKAGGKAVGAVVSNDDDENESEEE